MKNLTNQEQDELSKIILDFTGGKSFILMVGESPYPCPDEKTKEGCTAGHKNLLLVDGYENAGYVLGTLDQLKAQIEKPGVVPSPFQKNI